MPDSMYFVGGFFGGGLLLGLFLSIVHDALGLGRGDS